MKVLIAGGGIAGPAAAIALAKAGISAEIFEAYPQASLPVRHHPCRAVRVAARQGSGPRRPRPFTCRLDAARLVRSRRLRLPGQSARRCKVSSRLRNSASSLISSSFGDRLMMIVRTKVITEIPSTSGSRNDPPLAPGIIPGIGPG
jgi:glycine/D-amino acid oxidase-like deaminating enzyme